MSERAVLRVDHDHRGVATVMLDRPEARNAFNPEVIEALASALDALAGDEAVRIVVLTGAGAVFSAGADLDWMRATREWTSADNVADATRMDAMFRALWGLPKPVIGRINGHALGGGAGLVACCDVAVAVEGATFGFTEVTLGLVPAVISPYVVRTVGRSFARRMFTTGERFDAAAAAAAQLVHEVVPADELDAAVGRVVAAALRAGPRAAALAKTLPDRVLVDPEAAADQMPGLIAGVRASEEAQEGIAAFFDRRRPSWAPEDG